jgi:Serine hydrolase (FSH1)
MTASTAASPQMPAVVASMSVARAALFRCKLTVPSVHVTGRSDVIVPRRDSLLLAERFADPLVIEHPGGHVIPAGTAVTAPIADFLAGFSHSGSATPALDGSRSGQ